MIDFARPNKKFDDTNIRHVNVHILKYAKLTSMSTWSFIFIGV